MGIGDIDIEQCLTELPTWQSMTTQNRIAFFWWIAAVLFTLVLLWKVTGHSVFISMVFLGGIASEAVLYFSPTIYASGARVYYLTDLMYLFIILWMVMRMDSEKKEKFIHCRNCSSWGYKFSVTVFHHVIKTVTFIYK